MKNAYFIPSSLVLFLFVGLFIFSPNIQAQNSAFTFQGKLTDAGNPANGKYDLEIKLYDTPTGGNLLGTSLFEDVPVTGGIFTVNLDYGTEVFQTNGGRYLEIAVKPGASSGAFTAIFPRHELTASPYAIQAMRAEKAETTARFAGLLPEAFLRSDANQTFTGGSLNISPSSILNVQGALFGNGANLINLNASNISGGTLADTRLSGNIPRLNAYNVFTGGVQFNSPPIGSGEFLTNLSASSLIGTIPDARLSNNIPRLDAGNDFTGFNNFSRLSVGNPSFPVTKILMAAATLDFGNGRILQEVKNVSVAGARLGDPVFLSIPENVLPRLDLPPTESAPATTVTQPYIFQAFVSAPSTVSITYFKIYDPAGTGQSPCIGGDYNCEPPPGLFRVVVFSFQP